MGSDSSAFPAAEIEVTVEENKNACMSSDRHHKNQETDCPALTTPPPDWEVISGRSLQIQLNNEH